MPIELDPGEHRRNPLSFTLEAQVYDQNRQSIAGRATVLAHRAERYVGLALDRSVVAARETVEVTSVVTRYDGSRYDDAEVQVVLFSSRWMDEETVSPSG